MEGRKHFSHPHNLSFHKSLEGAQLTCTGCNFPCTGTPVYSCRRCKFFLHDQCFNAARSLIHPSHPAHPLSLFPSSTYSGGSFICSSCNQIGSGLCFCCSVCEFDLHIHCAYNDLKPNSGDPNLPPKKIQIKAHPNHPLIYLPKPPYQNGTENECWCDVCGTICDPNGGLYNCGSCGEAISQKHCMYYCNSGCDYGVHVQCVGAKVSEKAPAPAMDAMTFQLEMFMLQNKVKLNQMVVDTMQMGSHGLHRFDYDRRFTFLVIKDTAMPVGGDPDKNLG
ncbi:hypothetical protein LXL04_027734 [Taraxacum kok-saghyz]